MPEKRNERPQQQLITPSLSPPSRSRSFSCNPPTNPSNTGKASLSGSNPRSISRFSSTPLSSTDSPDIPSLRAQSTSRLLNVWSTLADRYSLRVDEDDIIDIRSGKVVKDRGVVRSLNGKWNFGRFASPGDDDGHDQPEADEDEGRETEETDDELDTLSYLDHQEHAPVNPFLSLSSLTGKATHAIDPNNDEDDAADLQAFLEAERQRKEKQGNASERDDTSGIMEDEEEYGITTDPDTDGFTTEAEPFSDHDEAQTVFEEHNAEDDHEPPLSQGKEGSDDELEVWDASDFDIVPSTDRPTEPSPDHADTSELSEVAHSHLITPPNSSTYSQNYTDTVESLASSPPSSRTRSRSRPRRPFKPLPSTTVARPLTPSSSSPFPIPSSSTLTRRLTPSSSNSVSSSSRIPRLDLSQLSRMQRGRSQSRSPSKKDQNNKTTAVADFDELSGSRTTEYGLQQSSVDPSSSSLHHKHNRYSSEAPGISKSNVRKSRNIKRSSHEAQVVEPHESPRRSRNRGRSSVTDVKGKGKAREVIEIDDSSESSPENRPPSPIRRPSAKAKGKKRARSSGVLYSSGEEYSPREPGGNDNTDQRERKPQGSPTKRGRYMDLSDTDPPQVRRRSAHSSSDPEFIGPVSDPIKLTSSINSASRKSSTNVHHQESKQEGSAQRRRRMSRRESYEDSENDRYQISLDTSHRSGGSSRSRSRAPVDSQRGRPPDPAYVDLIHKDYSMADPSPSRRSRFHDELIAEDFDSDRVESSISQATRLQKVFEGRAKDIISNAIEGLYSLLTPEGMASLRGQDESTISSSHRKYISHESPTRETNMMVYTPRRHTARPDPTFSRGTLPPSSPYSESDIEYRRDELDESDRDSNVEPAFTTVSSSKRIHHSSPIRPRARSGPSSQSNLHESHVRASSLVQRSRSRGRRVSFKEITSQTQMNSGETRRTLSREISVESPIQDIHRESRRVEVKVKKERTNDTEKLRRASSPDPSTHPRRKSMHRQHTPSAVHISPERTETVEFETRVPGRLRKSRQRN
ncbi:hypothetical protein C8R42DRAFT_775093 [Lentinula raphanica]|nr:hypothetical protein C8R42DRAFT_775093 [Lentinula raphanica]